MKIALLGCGNLVSAIFKGFYQKNPDYNFEILTYTPTHYRAEKLAKEIKGKAVENFQDLRDCDIFLFGFKPQNYSEAVLEYKKIIPAGKQIWSVLAGIDTEILGNDFPENSILRIMPSICAEVGESINLYTHSNKLDLKVFERIFSSVGYNYKTKNDDELDQLTGVSGSGPALLYYFFESLVDVLEKKNMEKLEIDKFIKTLCKGSVDLWLNKNTSLEDLRKSVTSKGGMTHEALKVFEDRGLFETSKLAVQAAYRRSKELKVE